MLKSKKFWFKFLKNTFALLLCVMVIFVSSFSVYAEDGVILRTVSYYSGYVPLSPISTNSATGNTGSSSYSAEAELTFRVILSDTANPYSFDGFFSLTNSFVVNFYPLVINSSSNCPYMVSFKDAYLYDINGTAYPLYSTTPSLYAYTTYKASTFYEVLSTPDVSFTHAFVGYGIPFRHSFIVRVKYVVWSQCPLVSITPNVPKLVEPGNYTLTMLESMPSTSTQLDQVNKNLGDANNKLDNLTDGYDNTAINDSNTELNNSLTEYDQQEDQAINTATDFFTEIKTPISFFDSGQFIASSSFVWSYLQGIYEHLGQAQVVVDVFLALTVAFTFVGLSRYIWRHSGRSSGGSKGG